MIETDPLLAAMNDDQSLNDRQVVQLLIDVLRDSSGSIGTRKILSRLRQIEQDFNGPRSATALRVLNKLNDVNVVDYSDYLYRLADQGIEFSHIFHERYPRKLWRLNDQPLALYKDGTVKLDREHVAIVGTRSATDDRVEDTRKIASLLGEENYTVVSGLARGVDTAAHKGALDGGGKTLAILPGDIESVYPKSNSELADEIREDGALVSEQSKFASMHNGRYIERNRITSGISDAIIVTASGETGGTVRQAEFAQSQGIPRFLYDPKDGSGQSPKVLRQLGFKTFSSTNELFNLLSKRKQLFDTTDTNRLTLSEF